jgi:ATP-dependent Clp protease ATP-binding subunit ClpB
MTAAGAKRILDLSKRSPISEELYTTFSKRIVGQPEAVGVLADLVERYMAGLCEPRLPVGTALFLGRTGVGKTACVEALCESLFGSPLACTKIDASEFAHSHEISKLIGSPSGYLGHRETPALLAQKYLDAWQTEKLKMNVLLIDEVEKASDSLWQLLLGVMDRATLTLGDNTRVDFSKTLIVFTSNLGAAEMAKVSKGEGLGFLPETSVSLHEKEIKEISVRAAKKHFTPEFMNRINHTVVFNTLTQKDIWTIMAIELGKTQQTIFNASRVFYYLEPEAKQTIFDEGHSVEYGARAMKRTIEKRVGIPMARLLASNQVAEGETVVIAKIEGQEEFEYSVGGGKKGSDIRAPKSKIEGDIL